jgi:HK97 family phage major capsid protein
MLVATPRAYGEFGFNPMSMGEAGEALMNKPVYTNGNWVALVGGATNNIGVTFANFDEAFFWVERKKLSIFVDPYSTRLSAGTVNFLPSARYAGATVNAAAVNGIELLS